MQTKTLSIGVDLHQTKKKKKHTTLRLQTLIETFLKKKESTEYSSILKPVVDSDSLHYECSLLLQQRLLPPL